MWQWVVTLLRLDVELNLIWFQGPQNSIKFFRPKAEQPAVPEEPSSKEEEKNDNKNLAAPDDIFSAKKKLGE